MADGFTPYFDAKGKRIEDTPPPAAPTAQQASPSAGFTPFVAPPEPSVWSNTYTGFARGLGNLLDKTGQTELIEQQAPPDVTPKPGEMSASVVNSMTGGNPYQPSTDLGRRWQSGVANFTEGAPTMAIGGGGVPGLLGRTFASAGSSAGGELGDFLFPDHPEWGRLAGSVFGGSVGGGLAPRPSAPKQPAMTMSEIDNTLANQGGYWTPSRIEAASELNKRQAVEKLLPSAVPQAAEKTPGLVSRVLSGAGNLYSKLPPKYQVMSAVPTGVGISQVLNPDHIANAASWMASNPQYAAALIPFLAARGMLNTQQTVQGTAAGIIPQLTGVNPAGLQ